MPVPAAGSSRLRLVAQPPVVDVLYPEPVARDRWVAEEPLRWLGPRHRPQPAERLDSLGDRGVLPESLVAVLALLACRRTSVLVIAGRSGAGKSTLLESLLPWYPATDRRIRLRGSFEDFRWEQDPRFDPGRSVLVAEEISGHLPTYLWGRSVERFLGWRSAGCALLATAHGETVEDVALLLSGYPLRLPVASLAAFDLVMRLGPAAGVDAHAVTDVWATGRTPAGGLVVSPLFDQDGLHRDVLGDVLERLGGDERHDFASLAVMRRELSGLA